MTYQIMFYGGMAGALISLVIAIIVFIKMDILLVIEDLTGIRLRKNSNSPQGGHHSFTEASSKSKSFTSRIFKVKKENPNGAAAASEIAATELINNTGDYRENDVAETTLLASYEDETTLLSSSEDETTLLSSYEDETTLLTEMEEDESDFKIQLNVIVVHSETII